MQAPTGYSGIYEHWGADVDGDRVPDSFWDFGSASHYPVLSVDMDGNGQATWQEFGYQLRAGPSLTAIVSANQNEAALSWTAVDTSHWSPAPTVTYTLYRDDGATVQAIAQNLEGLTYTDNSVTVGESYAYQVTAGVAGSESVRSAWVSFPTLPTSNPAPTGLPVIAGTAQAGETLTTNTSGIGDADGLDAVAFSYQWLADDADIPGAADATYTLSDADVGKSIKVRVTFTDNADHAESLTSAATAAVTARPNNPATGAPTISGTVQAGETLTADTSGITDADGLTNVAFSYQWLAADADILEATSSTYTLTDADVGKSIKVRVTFTDERGNDETLTSAATDTVAARSDSQDLDVPPGDPSTTVEVEVGDKVTGEIEEASEVDWFKLRLLESETYQIDMRGKWGGEWARVDGEIVWLAAGTLEDSKLLGVFSAANVLVPGTDEEVSGDDRGDYDEGKNSRIASFSPPADGYYYIAAAAEAAWTGTYELTVTVVADE